MICCFDRDYVRTIVQFEADFHDDAQWDDRGEPLVPGGKTLATWLAEELHKTFGRCLEVEQHEYFGWDFCVIVGRTQFFCLLQLGSPYVLSFETPGLHWLVNWHGARDSQEFAAALHGILSNDPRISSVRWFKREDYKGGRIDRGVNTPFA